MSTDSAIVEHASFLFRLLYLLYEVPTGFTYRNLHGFARFTCDSTALIHVYWRIFLFLRFFNVMTVNGDIICISLMPSRGYAPCFCPWNMQTKHTWLPTLLHAAVHQASAHLAAWKEPAATTCIDWYGRLALLSVVHEIQNSSRFSFLEAESPSQRNICCAPWQEW